MIKILQSLKPIAAWLFYLTLAVVTALLLWPFAPTEPSWEYKDKVEHMTVFTILALLGGLSYQQSLKKVALGLVIYGMSTEILQGTLTTTRQASVADWLADCAGIAIGLAIYRMLKKRKIA